MRKNSFYYNLTFLISQIKKCEPSQANNFFIGDKIKMKDWKIKFFPQNIMNQLRVAITNF